MMAAAAKGMLADSRPLGVREVRSFPIPGFDELMPKSLATATV